MARTLRVKKSPNHMKLHLLLALLLISINVKALKAQTPVTTTLSANVSDDSLPSPQTLTCTWTRVIGDSGDIIQTPTKVLTNILAWPQVVSTSATFTVAGSRTYRLTCNDGQLSAVKDVNFTVTVNQAPTITITSPANGAIIAWNRSTIIQAVADSGIVRTRLYINGTLTTTGGSSVAYSWRPGQSYRGRDAILKVTAENTAGQLTESSVTVHITR